jgi:ketosteroid isomerase-like protein
MLDEDAILAANAAYYRAFAAGDFAGMCGIWAEEQVSCIHPGWPVLIGRRAILDSYRSILRNPQQEPIEHHNATPLVTDDDGRVFCIEIVSGMALAATNWFRRIDGTWRMIHHQASPIATQVEQEHDEERPPGRLN